MLCLKKMKNGKNEILAQIRFMDKTVVSIKKVYPLIIIDINRKKYFFRGKFFIIFCKKTVDIKKRLCYIILTNNYYIQLKTQFLEKPFSFFLGWKS